MKKILSLFLTLLLVACGGGGGGSNSGATNTQPTNAPDPSIPNILDELSAAEQLFGQGNGTGATPTNLLAQTDNLGFEYLSFGAWGNVYDIKHNESIPPAAAYGKFSNFGYYSFIPNSENENMTAWNNPANASVANSAFTGPAIMQNYVRFFNTYGQQHDFYHSSDYGTLQVAFGNDFHDYICTFTMHDTNNNLTLTAADVFTMKFNEDNDHVRVNYSINEGHESTEDGTFWYTKTYQGYGIKQ